jgi:hypothetical protein
MTSESLNVRVLKAGTCPTLSGRGSLKYEIGTDDAANLAFRLTGNSGGGFFNGDWVPFDAVSKILQSPYVQKGLSSTAFVPIFRGKSMNSPAFLAAVLKAEGVFRLQAGKSRSYEVGDLEGFLASVSSHTSFIPGKASAQGGKPSPAAKKTIPAKKTKA